MPRIPEYISTENLTPSDRGANAWENAARRIPGFYNAAASNEREGGRVEARAFRQRQWPWDIQELYARRAAAAAAAASAPEREKAAPTFRVAGNIAPLEAAERRNARASQQIASGAGALGGMLSDGGSQAAARGSASGGRAPEGYTLQGGELITASDARKAQDKYNADRDAMVQADGDRLVDTQNYWLRYNGGSPNSMVQSQSNQPGPLWRNPDNGTDPGQYYQGTQPTWGGNPGGAVDAWRPAETSWSDSITQSLAQSGAWVGGVVNYAVDNVIGGSAPVTAPIPRE